tara:strand:+ start:8643 stop:9080 length:438 start_codon:yes stop_codon:yes gene_type:complete
MNVGFYISSLSQGRDLDCIFTEVARYSSSKNLEDASIFYNDVGPYPKPFLCGAYNSVDLWAFEGNLVTRGMDNTSSAIEIVNKFKIYEYCDIKFKDNILLFLKNCDKINGIICDDDQTANEVYRISGKKPLGVSNNYKEIIDIIS